MKTQQRHYEQRIGLLWPCVLLASVLFEKGEGEYLHGLCYIQVYRILCDGVYLARIAATPDTLAEGATYLLTEEQLWYARPLDIRLSVLTPARLRTLLKECGDELHPPQRTFNTATMPSLEERVAEESGAFSREALRLAEITDQEISTATVSIQSQPEETHALRFGQTEAAIQSLYLPSEILEETFAVLPLPLMGEKHLKKCRQCRNHWLQSIRSRLPDLLAHTVLPVITQIGYTVTSKVAQQIFQELREAIAERRLPQVILHLSAGYTGGIKKKPRGWLIGIHPDSLAFLTPQPYECW